MISSHEMQIVDLSEYLKTSANVSTSRIDMARYSVRMRSPMSISAIACWHLAVSTTAWVKLPLVPLAASLIPLEQITVDVPKSEIVLAKLRIGYCTNRRVIVYTCWLVVAYSQLFVFKRCYRKLQIATSHLRTTVYSAPEVFRLRQKSISYTRSFF